jgi:hypothetical protein
MGRGFGSGGGEKVGPIIGVHSTSCKESIKVYEGRTRYCEWKFLYQEQQQQGGGRRPPPASQTPGSGDGNGLPFGTPPLPETTPTPGG